MFNFFKKKENEEIWYSFFYSLFTYCEDKNENFLIDCSSYDYCIEYNYSTFPFYYNYEEELENFKKSSFKNFYEVLNAVYQKANINTIKENDAIKNELEFNIWNIKIPLIQQENSLFFKIFFVDENNGKLSYRILYYYAEDDTLDNLGKKIEYLPINLLKNISTAEAQHFLTTIVVLAKYSNIEVPEILQKRFLDVIVETPVSIEDFERIINLVNLNSFEYNVKQISKEMFGQFLTEKPSTPNTSNSPVNFEDTTFSQRFNIFLDDNIWQSDWKFDPEDAEYFINQLLLNFDLSEEYEDNWTFEYPENTYSHDLFPYIQKGLEKIGLTLMNIQTWGDEYLFFVIKKENIDEVLKLSKKLKLEYELI